MSKVVTIDPLGPYCENRVFEWTMTAAMLGVGISLIFWPQSIQLGNFRPLLNLLGSTPLTAIYLMAGFVRLNALLGNGKWLRWGTRLRAVGAVCGFIFWLQMALALWLQLPHFALSVPVFLALAGGELWSVGRARRDDNGCRRT